MSPVANDAWHVLPRIQFPTPGRTITRPIRRSSESRFRIKTQPVTIVGIAPQGCVGDRRASNLPQFYLPAPPCVLYQGTTSVVPKRFKIKPGFSP